MTNGVYNDISLQKCPSRKQKEQEEENPQNAHEKLLQSSWEKHFFTKVGFKHKYLILNEIQLILNILQFTTSYSSIPVTWIKMHNTATN